MSYGLLRFQWDGGRNARQDGGYDKRSNYPGRGSN